MRASTGTPSARLNAAAEIEIRPGEITNVGLTLTPDLIFRGRLRTDDGSPLQKGGYPRLVLQALGRNGFVEIQIPDDGVFQAAVAKLGSYRLDFDVPQGWYVASATIGGRDALADDIQLPADGSLEPLDAVLSRASGSAEFSLPADAGPGGYMAHLVRRVGSRVETPYFSPGRLRIVSGTTVTWTNIPPGSYWAFAAPDVNFPYMDVDFLGQYREFIQEVEVRPDSISRVELKILNPH